jgi:hypothetical protein
MRYELADNPTDTYIVHELRLRIKGGLWSREAGGAFS